MYIHSSEIASVGLMKKVQREQVIFSSENFLLQRTEKLLFLGEQVGKVKVIVEPKYQEIVGISIIGPHATELIGQGT